MIIKLILGKTHAQSRQVLYDFNFYGYFTNTSEREVEVEEEIKKTKPEFRVRIYERIKMRRKVKGKGPLSGKTGKLQYFVYEKEKEKKMKDQEIVEIRKPSSGERRPRLLLPFW